MLLCLNQGFGVLLLHKLFSISLLESILYLDYPEIQLCFLVLLQ